MSIADTYSNPVIFADYSDPDVVRAGNGYYMTASSFNYTPGLPILYSTDLVHWTHIGYALKALGPGFEEPRHSEGVWAPSIRYINDMFYIYYGMPDEGLYVVRGRLRADLPAGVSVLESAGHDASVETAGSYICNYGLDLRAPGLEGASVIWDKPVRVLKGKGLIDPCPVVCDDGRIYLVHAYAKSRIGFKSMLGIVELDADGLHCISEDRIIFNGNIADASGREDAALKYKYPADTAPDECSRPAITIEGPKVYIRNGYYYILAPAGGVRYGWQLALKSKDLRGPYEYRVVMHQGASGINGPHQGGMVTDDDGKDFFLHFQDMGAYGRVCHLQPVRWQDDWPVIGRDTDGSGCGAPVTAYSIPKIQTRHTETYTYPAPSSTDLQWMGDYSTEFFEVVAGRDMVVSKDMADLYFGRSAYEGGRNRLKLQALNMQGSSPVIWKSPNVLTRKIDARNYSVSVTLDVTGLNVGDRAGCTVIGGRYAFIECERLQMIKALDSDSDLDSEKDRDKAVAYRIYYGTGIADGADIREERRELCTVSTDECMFTVRIEQTDREDAMCVDNLEPVIRFAYGVDTPADSDTAYGVSLTGAGESFIPSDHTWTGAKLGIYAISASSRGGHVIVEDYVYKSNG